MNTYCRIYFHEQLRLKQDVFVARVRFFYFACKFQPVPPQLGDIMRHLRPGPSAIQAYGGIKEGCCCPTGDAGICFQNWGPKKLFSALHMYCGCGSWCCLCVGTRGCGFGIACSVVVSWPNHVASTAASSAAVQEEESM